MPDIVWVLLLSLALMLAMLLVFGCALSVFAYNLKPKPQKTPQENFPTFYALKEKLSRKKTA